LDELREIYARQDGELAALKPRRAHDAERDSRNEQDANDQQWLASVAASGKRKRESLTPTA
jgi:hypothetical protein